jgi:putative endonuclease
MYYVYLLKSKKDNNYYTGQTNDIQKRLKEHNNGRSKSTKARRPFELIGYEGYLTQGEARIREHQLKNYLRRKKEFIEAMKQKYENRKEN